MPVLLDRGRRLDLGSQDFVAQGGQASVYAKGSVAYKLFTDPTHTPDSAKIQALAALDRPDVVAPTHLVHDEQQRPIGFSMRLLTGWHPLVRCFPPAYQQRCGLDLPWVLDTVLRLRAIVAHAHAHQALIVDLNELNVLVSPDHSGVAAIDVDSWQVPGFPATALAESVRDRHRQGFSTDTDWFAFAVVTFQLFTGIHPYRGGHARLKTLDARMLGNVCVFHPDVVVPPMVDLGRLPGSWRDWYEDVFALGDRDPPPLDGAFTARAPRALPGVTVEVQGLLTASGPIVGAASWDGRIWVWTDQGTYEGGRRCGPPPQRGAQAFRTPEGLAFARLQDGQLCIVRADGSPVPNPLQLQQLVAHEGLLHGLSGGSVLEIGLRTFGGVTQVVPREAIRVAPHASTLYRGCVVSQVLGSTWLSLLAEGTCTQVRDAFFDGARIVDAVHTRGVTVLQTLTGQDTHQHVLGQGARRTVPTQLGGIELRVFPTGVAMLSTADGLLLFSAGDPLGAARKVVVDLPGPLLDLGGRPGFLQADRAYTLSLKR